MRGGGVIQRIAPRITHYAPMMAVAIETHASCGAARH
jgi:hypothetical protein